MQFNFKTFSAFATKAYRELGENAYTLDEVLPVSKTMAKLKALSDKEVKATPSDLLQPGDKQAGLAVQGSRPSYADEKNGDSTIKRGRKNQL